MPNSSSSSSSSSSPSSSSSSSSKSSSSSSSSFSSVVNSPYLDFSYIGVNWNRSKIVPSETSCPNTSSIQNKMAQSCKVGSTKIQCNNVSLYFGAPLGIDTSYNVVVEIHEADENGFPVNMIGSSTIAASDIKTSGWVMVPIEIVERDSPDSGLICFVVYQDGGSENNYVPWLYSTENLKVGWKALVSNNGGVTWTEQIKSIRAVKMLGGHNPLEEAYLDTPEHAVSSSPGYVAVSEAEGLDYLSGGNTDGTTISDGDTPYVSITNSNAMVSFVVDSSGSEGWKDRNFKRKETLLKTVNFFKEKYPNQVLFDIIKFGSLRVATTSASFNSSYAAIRVDLNSPESYLLNSDGSVPSIEDGLVAWGLLDLEPKHTYVFCGIKAENKEIESGSGQMDYSLGILKPTNYQSVGLSMDPVLFSIANNGIGSEKEGEDGEPSVNIKVSESGASHIRKPIGTGRYLFLSGTNGASSGDNSVEIYQPSGFEVNELVDIISSSKINLKRTITSLTGSSATIDQDLTFSSGNFESGDGTFIQESSVPVFIDGKATTLEILLKDQLVTRPVKFYIQTSKEGRMEWDITACNEWVSEMNCFYDLTANFSVSGIDSNGNTLKDGTEVRFYVDGLPSNLNANVEESTTESISPPIEVGDSSIHINDITFVSVGDSVTLASSNGASTLDGFVVTAVDLTTGFITIYPPNYADFVVEKVIITKAIELAVGSDPLCVDISAIDATPIYAGRNIDPGLLDESDPNPVPYLPDDPNLYNQDESRRRDGSFSVPCIDGKAAAWILPITDDVVRTESAKEDNSSASINPSILTDEERMEIEAQEEDYYSLLGSLPPEEQAASDIVQSPELSPVTVETKDYTIQTPVYMYGGEAASSMTTSSLYMSYSELANGYSFDPKSNDRMALFRDYRIYPVIIIKDRLGRDSSLQVLQEFDLNFVSPYHIFSKIDEQINIEHCTHTDPATGELITFDPVVPGAWSASKKPIKIDYTVWDRNSLMKSGFLRIKIVDPHRDPAQMINANELVPDFKEEVCKVVKGVFVFNIEEHQSPFFHTFEKPSTEVWVNGKTYIDSILTTEVTYLNEYSGEFLLPITNGKASFTITAPDEVVAKIIVYAELTFPSNSKMSIVKPDPIWFKNPLSLEVLGLGKLESGEDRPPTEISAIVTWMGEPTIYDNVEVSFRGSVHAAANQQQGKVPADSEIGQTLIALGRAAGPSGRELAEDFISRSGSWPATRISPSISKTVSGYAKGCFIGPHGLVKMHYTSEGGLLGDVEAIQASVKFGAYQANIKIDNEWVGYTKKNDFNFNVSLYKGSSFLGGSINLYADGWDYAYAVADIPYSIELGFPFMEDFEDYLIGEDKSGNPLGNGVLRGVAKPVNFSSSGFYSTTMWSKTMPIDPENGETMGMAGQDGSRGWAASKKISSSRKPEEPPGCNGCCESICTEINVSTYVFILNPDPRLSGNYTGSGCATQSLSNCYVIIEGEAKIVSPTVFWVEPLKGEGFIYSVYGETASRDGKNGTTIIADVSFSGSPIPFLAKEHNKDITMPEVTFTAYYVHNTYDEDGRIIQSKKVTDESLNFTNSSVTLSLSMTSDSGEVNNNHYHECTVDVDGNGVTTGTFLSKSRVLGLDHIHIIRNYEIESLASNGESHNHSLKSVAITELKPIQKTMDSICIEAFVKYDASRDYVDRGITFKFCDDPTILAEEYISIKLDLPPKIFTSESITSEYSGFKALATINKHFADRTIVPVEDGLRVRFTMTPFPYIYEESSTQTESEGLGSIQSSVMNQNEPIYYMALKVEASVTVDGIIYSDSGIVKVMSNMNWIPDVIPLTTEPTDDDFYINEAVDKIETLGPSQLHDAVMMAAERMSEWQANNPSWRNSRKTIVLLTDGDENMSMQSVNQAIARVNSLNGSGNSPVCVFVNGIPNPVDSLILDRYTSQTMGASKTTTSQTDSELDQDVKDMFSGEIGALNSGSYSNILDLGSSNMPESISLNSVIPLGANVSISVRSGNDLANMGAWSQSVNIGESASIDLSSLGINQNARYFEYVITMNGNEEFSSPEVSGVQMTYIAPKVNTIVFQPIYLNTADDEYVNEIVISNNVEIPSSSEIKYGVVQADTINDSDYFSLLRPVRIGGRTVMLSRSDEIMTTNDQITYVMTGGSYPNGVEVEIYRTTSSGTSLVNQSEYIASPESGSIRFFSKQDSKSILSTYIFLPPILRLICQIYNYSEETAKIHNISVMYNTTKRIGRGGNGKIVNE